MLGGLPCFVFVANFALSPARRMTRQAMLPRDRDRAVLGAAAVHVIWFAFPTCFAILLRNLRPFGVAVSMPALNPPAFSVATTLGSTTLAVPDALIFFDEPNLRPTSFSLNF